MCLQYLTGKPAAYVRLCYRTGHRGEHWPLAEVLRVDQTWTGTGCVRVPRQRRQSVAGEPGRTMRRASRYRGSLLPCRRCGTPTVDEICDACKPRGPDQLAFM